MVSRIGLYWKGETRSTAYATAGGARVASMAYREAGLRHSKGEVSKFRFWAPKEQLKETWAARGLKSSSFRASNSSARSVPRCERESDETW